MFCFLFPILPTSLCLFNGNYLQILCGEAIYINKICILNWFSFSFLLQMYLPAHPPAYIHHWSHSSHDCWLQLKKLHHQTQKAPETEDVSIFEPSRSWAAFFQAVPKMTRQENRSCSGQPWQRTAAVLRGQHWDTGCCCYHHFTSAFLKSPPACTPPSQWAAELHRVALTGRRSLGSSFVLLTVFVHTLIIYIFFMMRPVLHKQCMLTS